MGGVLFISCPMAESLSPQDTPQLVTLLRNAAFETNERIRKESSSMLEKWEKLSGYCSLLFGIISDLSIDHEIRFIATSCFKNAVHKYWRKKDTSMISKQEKDYIHQNLPNLFDEPNNRNALHIGLLYAKIARVDYPAEWPEALSLLCDIEANPNTSPLRKLRALTALKQTVKSLSTKVLLIDRKHFRDVSASVFRCIHPIWQHTNTQIIQQIKQLAQGQQFDSSFQPTAEACKLSLQILQVLIVCGIPPESETDGSREFPIQLLNSQKEYLVFRKAPGFPEHIQPIVEKLISIGNKTASEFHKRKTEQFAPYLMGYLELYWAELMSMNTKIVNEDSFFHKLSVTCICFLKEVLSKHFIGSRLVPESPSMSESLKQMRRIVMDIFTVERVSNLSEQLISQFFILSSNDLELWQSDPEEFIEEISGDDYAIRCRPSAEALYEVCLGKFPDDLQQHTLRLLASVQINEPESLERVLLRDACYHALGLSLDHHYLEISFEQWMEAYFLKDLKTTNRQHFIILSRKIAWLLGRWVTKITDETRTSVYQLLIELMKETDLVTQITAAEALASVIDDLKFSLEGFKSFLPAVVNCLFSIIAKTKRVEVKMQLINVLSVIVEQSNSQISPFSRQIFDCLAQLWNSSNSGENSGMMKNVIIRSILKLVVALKQQVTEFYPILLPLIKTSTDVSQPETIYTLEDGISVWLQTMLQVPQSHPDLYELFPNLLTIMAQSFENTENCMEILEAYFLIGGEHFLSLVKQQVSELFLMILGNVRDRGTKLVVGAIVTLVQSVPTMIESVLGNVLVKCFQLLFSEKEPEGCKHEYLFLFSHMILQNPTNFITLCQQLSDQMVHQYVTITLQLMPSIEDIEYRKTIAMALVKLLSVGGDAVLRCLPGILDCIVMVMRDEEHNTALFDTDYYHEFQDADEEKGSIVDDAKMALYRQNPIQREKLHHFAFNTIQQLSQISGTQQYFSTVPPNILQQITQLK